MLRQWLFFLCKPSLLVPAALFPFCLWTQRAVPFTLQLEQFHLNNMNYWNRHVKVCKNSRVGCLGFFHFLWVTTNSSCKHTAFSIYRERKFCNSVNCPNVHLIYVMSFAGSQSEILRYLWKVTNVKSIFVLHLFFFLLLRWNSKQKSALVVIWNMESGWGRSW